MTRSFSKNLSFLLDYGPLVLFFIAYKAVDLFFGTLVLMDSTLVGLLVSYLVHKKLSAAQMVTGVCIILLGTLTLVMHDEQFIKIKPTLIYLIFGSLLIGGLLRRKALLRPIFGHVFELTPHGWNRFTLRWGIFFFALAGLNEIVWRFYSTDFWVKFKIFGTTGLMMGFLLCQIPLILREEVKEVPE